MTDGWSFLLAQIAVPLVLAALVGAVAGFLLASGVDGHRHAHHPTPVPEAASDQLTRALRTVESLQEQLGRVRDEKDTEMGRLETHAIEAMESTMSRSEQRIDALERELADARAALRRSEDDLTTQRGQTERLRKALSERDARITRLRDHA